MFTISDRHRDEILAMLAELASMPGGDRRLANLRRRARIITRVLMRKKPITKDKDNDI